MPSVSDRTWLWIASAFYLAGFVIGTIALLRERRHSRAIMYVIVSAGFTLQTFGLYLRGLAVKGCPIGNTFEIFQFTAWSATALYLVIGPTFRLSLLGYFTSCLTATLTLISLSVPAWDAALRVGIFGGNTWIEFHAALALFSYGVFGLLALTSIMYLLQVFSLKRHHLRGLFSFLPSIVDLDHINLRLLSAGVILMTASIGVGSVYWVQDTATVNMAKLITTIAVWLSYALTLGCRLGSVLVSKRLAWTCIILFAAALISLGPVSSSRKPLPPAQTIQQR
jgi:HemX protein